MNPITIEYRETDKPTPSVRIIAVFLVFVFVLIPLVEIVPDFEYNIVSSFKPTQYTCIVGWESLEPLSFKKIELD